MGNRSAFVLGAVVGLSLLCAGGSAQAESIIKRPGAHPHYAVELEPHFVFQWANRWGRDDGIGLGLRANVNIVDDGFIKKINDSVAIGFGLDVTFNDDSCGWFWYRNDPRFRDNFKCSVTEFWFPVVMQWNFWLTDVISVFGEPGLAFAHRRWSYEWYCNTGAGTQVCDYDDTDNDLEPVFWGGARFMFSESIGATVRVGTPYVSAGINFLL
ncbi:MAG: hypothetical protein R3B13_22895 [Polyangiaceae bacterium]